MIGELCALGSAVAWAVSVILFKHSEAVSPLALNLFKNVVAIVLLIGTVLLGGRWLGLDRPTGDLVRLAASGVLGIALADTLFFMALRTLGPGLLAVVECVYAPTIVLLSVWLLGEPLGSGFLIGAVLVVGGVLVITWRAGERTTLTRAELLGGVAIGIGGVVSMAVGIVIAKPVLEGGFLAEDTLVRLIAGVAGQLLWMLLVPRQREALAVLRPSPVWRTLLPAAILGAYVAMLLWLGGFKWADASVAAVLNQTTTVYTIVLAWLILGEPLTTRRIVGALLAMVGASLVLAF